MAESVERKSFWTTLPGVLTAVAAVVTAVAGLVAAFGDSGLFAGRAGAPQAAVEISPAKDAATQGPTVAPPSNRTSGDNSPIVSGANGNVSVDIKN